MANFAFENNYFEFNGYVKQQILGAAKGTKFAAPNVCIFMDKVETRFSENRYCESFNLAWMYR